MAGEDDIHKVRSFQQSSSLISIFVDMKAIAKIDLSIFVGIGG